MKTTRTIPLAPPNPSPCPVAMKIKTLPMLIAIAIANLLAAPAQIHAAESQARPTFKELRPVMEKAVSEIFNTKTATAGDKLPARKVEVLEIGAQGWAPLTGPDNEDTFWPVKVKCSIPSPGKATTEEIVLIIRAYRGGSVWKADTTEIYSISSLQGLLQSRQRVRTLSCINLLRMIDGAKEQWALESKKKSTDEPTMSELVGRDKYLRTLPICPEGGNYTINPLNKQPKCSIPEHALP